RLRLSPDRVRANIVQTLSENPHFTGPITVLPSDFFIDWRSLNTVIDQWKESDDVDEIALYDRQMK
ncbi:hypothetical protein PENTCL1PPCAC_5481, partial [Pristionchus entomophagus]